MASFTQKLSGEEARKGKMPLVPCLLLTMLFIIIFLSTLFSDFLPTAFGAYSDQRFLQVAVLPCVLMLAFAPVKSCPSIKGLLSDTWPVFFVAVMFVICALPFASNTFNWVEPGLFAFYFLAFSVLGWRLRAGDLTDIAVKLFVCIATVACFFYAAMTITVYLFALTDRFASLTDIIPWGFVNMRYWSHIATWVLPILPLAVMVGPLAEKKKWHWCVGFSAAIWWWVVFMTTARGTLMSLALASVVALLVFGKQLLPWLKVFFKFLLFGIAAWALLSVAIPSLIFDEVTVRTLHAGNAGRFLLWKEAWLMSLLNFPWGLGPQSWLTHELNTELGALPGRFGHPHNMYLLWAAEYGWMLVGAFLALIFLVLKKLVFQAKSARASSTDASPLVAFTIASMAGFAHAGVSAVFIVPGSMLVGFCILGIFWSLIHGGKRHFSVGSGEQCWKSKGVVYCLLLSGVMVGGVLWSGEVWRYHQAMEADLVQYEQEPNAGKYPRFWFHGNFPRVEQNYGPAFADD